MKLMNKNLQQLRNQIDAIDKEIVTLVSDRLRVALDIAMLKKGGHLPVFNQSRERQVIEQVFSHARFKKLDTAFVTRMFRIIINESRRLQKGIVNGK